ncbi:MAG: 30S ribosomal protein S12 methylthiotransferase RimO [Candidatus Omnitrophica bacterium]|nr:30S ribosomal protein S12 methylthiotransferase RimO [Candidatus Omnitrophota bacterium]
MTFSIKSLGCPKNLVDSEKIAAQLSQAGLVFTDTADDAQVMILNTCGFIKPAIEESITEIKKLILWKRKRPNRKLLICGCLVNRLKDKLVKHFPEVDDWLKIKEEGSIANLITDSPSPSDETRLISTPRHYAYLKIAEGCSNRCSYCTIPQIRGPLQSRALGSIVNEATQLTELGIKELILVGQDTAGYGTDLNGGKPLLAHLVDKLSCIDGIKWLRILYAHPAHIDDRLIDTIGSNPKVCKYLDIPIQHISDRILKLMRRRYNRKTIEKLVEKLKRIPDMKLRTTVIIGFPTEKPQEFNELLEFIGEGHFDHIGYFPYYREIGTEAAKLQPLPDCRIDERLRQFADLQIKNTREKNRSRIGQKIIVIIDGYNRKRYFGRSQSEAPEIDGKIFVSGQNLRIGKFYTALIKGFKKYDLFALPLQEARW